MPNRLGALAGVAEGEGWSLVLDIDITRRKTYHLVVDPAGAVQFRSRYPSECMAWLANEGVERYTLNPARDRSLGLPQFDIAATRK